jgi:hypothetical protein
MGPDLFVGLLAGQVLVGLSLSIVAWLIVRGLR